MVVGITIDHEPFTYPCTLQHRLTHQPRIRLASARYNSSGWIGVLYARFRAGSGKARRKYRGGRCAGDRCRNRYPTHTAELSTRQERGYLDNRCDYIRRNRKPSGIVYWGSARNYPRSGRKSEPGWRDRIRPAWPRSFLRGNSFQWTRSVKRKWGSIHSSARSYRASWSTSSGHIPIWENSPL